MVMLRHMHLLQLEVHLDRKWHLHFMSLHCKMSFHLAVTTVSSHLRPTGAPGSNEQYNVGMVGTHGLETSHADTFGTSISREGTLMIREVSWCNSRRKQAQPLRVFSIQAFT